MTLHHLNTLCSMPWDSLPANQVNPTLHVANLEMVQLSETKQSNMILTADLGEGGEFFFFLSKRVSPVSLGKHMDKGLAQARNLPGHILQSNLCAGGLRHLFWKATIQQIQFNPPPPKTKAIWTRVWGIKIYTKTIAVLTDVTSLNKRKFNSSFHIRRGKPNNEPTVDLF